MIASTTPLSAHIADWLAGLLGFAGAARMWQDHATPADGFQRAKTLAVAGGAIGMWGLRIAVAIGVAVGVSLGTYRIVTGLPLHYFIIAAYIVVVTQTAFAPRLIIPLAYDSGGVTTSTVTVPLIAALGLGLAETVPGRNVLIDGFGLIAFACLFPIMSVMAYAQISEYRARRQRAGSGE